MAEKHDISSRRGSMRLAFNDYMAEIRRHKFLAVPGLLFPGIGNVFVGYVPALIIARIITDFDGTIPGSLNEILPYILVLGGAWLFGEIIWRIGFLLQSRAAKHSIENLYTNALQQLLKQDTAFFNENFAGSLTRRAMGYGRNFEMFYDTLAFSVFGGTIPLIFALVILWAISPLLVFVLLGIIVLTILIIAPIIRARQKLVRERELAGTTMTGHVADVIGNISAVQSYAHEAEEQARHTGYVKTYSKTMLKSWDFQTLRVDTIVAPLNVITNVVGLTLAVLVSDDAATMAAVFVAFTYFSQATRIMFDFNRTYRNIESSLTDAGQFCELIANKPLITEAPNAKQIAITEGAVKFENVSFAYHDAPDQLLFKNLNLAINPGERVALVGHSGGGKTTITKLLQRFNDVTDGKLLIDGQDIREATLHSLRSQIASVPQDPAMFHRSVMENIRYGRLNATDEEVVAAARKAHALEFIEKLPDGIDTLVGERGVKLSGGQRQRIAIARAIIKDAPILVLDEATSALDSESEAHIQKALWELMKGRTAIVIAHRLSTIQKMDRIIVLENGKIVEEGSHKELLTKKGTYAKLWAHQSGGFIEE